MEPPANTLLSERAAPAIRLARFRAVAGLAGLIAGLIIARAYPGVGSTLWFSLAAAACGFAAIASGSPCKAALLAAIVLLGAGTYSARLQEHHRDSLAFLLDAHTPTILTIDATIVEEPIVVKATSGFIARGPSLVFRVRAARLVQPLQSPRLARGVFRVRAPVELRERLRIGQRIRVTGNAKGLAPPLNPGQTDRRPVAYQRGEIGSISVPNAELIEVLDHESWRSATTASLLRAKHAIQTRATRLLLDPISGDDAQPSRTMLAALILGQRDRTNADQRAAFTRIGIAHLMAISGFHVAMMVLVAMLLVRCLGDLGRLEPLIVAFLVVVYLVIVPASPPVLRAASMVLVVLASEALGRRYDRLSLLIWTAFILLLVRPADLWSMGFQLSFTLVAALMVLAKPAHEAIWGLRVRTDIPQPIRWWQVLIESAKLTTTMTVVCWLVAMPLVIYHTGLVSPLAIVTTAITLPLIMLIVLLAYAALIIGVVVPPAASAAGWVLDHLAAFTLWVVNHLDAIPGSSFTLPRVSLAWTIVAAILAATWLYRGQLRDSTMWIATLGIALWLGAEVWSRTHLPPSQKLRIDVLAVGDGTCMLVRAGSDAILWDCGSESTTAGSRLIPRAVRALDGHKVRTVIITHPNADHYNALFDALQPLGVQRVLLGERFMDAAAMTHGSGVREVLAQLDTTEVVIETVRQGETIRIGDSTLTFLSPPRDASWTGHNNHSLVARIDTPVTGGIVTTLLTGDIERQAIAHLIESNPNLKPKILEIPHHGSVNDAAAELVSVLDPDVVIQSTGPSRSNDPRWNFAREGRRWLTTADVGCASVIINRDGSISTATTR